MDFWYYSWVIQKFKMHLTGLKSGVDQAAFLSGGCRRESIFLPFPASRGVCMPWCMPPSIKFFSWCHFSVSTSSRLALMTTFYSGPFSYIWGLMTNHVVWLLLWYYCKWEHKLNLVIIKEKCIQFNKCYGPNVCVTPPNSFFKLSILYWSIVD